MIDALLKLNLISFLQDQGHVFHDNKTLCPFHDDHEPSLNVTEKNGVWLWYCHACKVGGSIINFVMRKDGLDKPKAIRKLAKQFNLETLSPKPELEAQYSYTDERGGELFRVLRFHPKSFKTDRIMDGVRQVPYRLPDILAADTVWLLEGEKDTDNAKQLGLAATTAPFGVGHWKPEFSQYFKGKRVMVCLDSGYEREARRRAAGLVMAGAKQVKIITLPGLKKDQDLSDWIEIHDSQDNDSLRSILEKIAADAPPFELPSTNLRIDDSFLEFFRLNISAFLKTGAQLQTLDLHTEWTFGKLIPERAITILHGPGGIGKTWLGLMIAKAVSEGQQLFGIEAKKKLVIYLDFENPLPVLVERVREMGLTDVMFWHLGFESPPPRLDSNEWRLYKELPKESLIIIDSLRSSQSGDENSSQDMALIMGRLKELREQGRDILVYHHSSKADERSFRGSMAITDLADHVVSLYKVNQRFEEIDNAEPDPDALYRFGTGIKTRYERFGIFLTFNGQGFELAQDPDETVLEAIQEFIRAADHPVNQSQIFTWAKAELEVRKKTNLAALLRKGEKINLWDSFLEQGNTKRRIYRVPAD